MSELEHFWSMTDRSYSLGNRAIELLNTLRLDGVQPNMNYYVWGDGAEDDLRDGLLVLLTSVINDELSEDCPPLANLVNVNIYKQGMASQSPTCDGGYTLKISTEDIISASFDYDRDTIEDVFLKLIEPNGLGTSDTHYLKTVAGRILQDNSYTLFTVNRGSPFDTLERDAQSLF